MKATFELQLLAKTNMKKTLILKPLKGSMKLVIKGTRVAFQIFAEIEPQ
jgi:hypothetical protein